MPTTRRFFSKTKKRLRRSSCTSTEAEAIQRRGGNKTFFSPVDTGPKLNLSQQTFTKVTKKTPEDLMLVLLTLNMYLFAAI